MKRNSFLISGIIVLAISCVPARKYQEMTSKVDNCENNRAELIEKNKELEIRVLDLEDKITKLTSDVNLLTHDTMVTGNSLRKMTLQYDKINKLNDELIDKIRQLQKSNETESVKLMSELDRTKKELMEKEDDLRDMEKSLNSKEKNLSGLQEELKKREQRVEELEKLISQKEEATEALRRKITNALLGFKDKGLTIEQKNGNIYISLDAKLLFAKGSTVVDQEGKKALQDLAQVLKDQDDISILVEGHTDTDKITGGSMKDNWDLSVLRATSVVRILTEKNGVDTKRITAAGRGEYLPIDPGVNEMAKSKNRRIEIIIMPNLDKLFEIIEKN